ncbi:MAG TPA: ATP phosphoribosyltransferase [Candidatus Atribacteria bacterium]|nr:ATP phosphoribosyltransferase [Candidatus Atribacteria bacterium]HQE24973.1 ATP phosphoribosyltransferase [Candidatus Atribacteria bacterium]
MEKLTISVPTGRMKEGSLALLSRLPQCPPLDFVNSRQLVVEREDLPWRIIFSHPKDSSTYVEFGAADIGIVGKDILLERENEVYELLELPIGRCAMVLAAPLSTSREELLKKEALRIATTYPNFTRRYLQERGMTADIVFLYGSVELAPPIGLADAIVDLVSTGKTLRDNRLQVVEEITPISARLVANPISIKTHSKEIYLLVKELKEVISRV